MSWYDEHIIRSSLELCRVIQVLSLEVNDSIIDILRFLEATIMTLGHFFLHSSFSMKGLHEAPINVGWIFAKEVGFLD